MSAPAKTTIAHDAPACRVYGHGVVVALPEGLRGAGSRKLLNALGIKHRKADSADHALHTLIEARARELPLPPAVAITAQARVGNTDCTDLVTIITVLAKSSARVYLRDKEPNLSAIIAGRRLVLLLPGEVRL
jgi:hypothetical protein